MNAKRIATEDARETAAIAGVKEVYIDGRTTGLGSNNTSCTGSGGKTGVGARTTRTTLASDNEKAVAGININEAPNISPAASK